MTHDDFCNHLSDVLTEIEEMLVEKNRKYGNSALEPQRVFSRASPLEQLNVRIDDKISRLQSGQPDDQEDAARDLLGYLIMREIALKVGPTIAEVDEVLKEVWSAPGPLADVAARAANAAADKLATFKHQPANFRCGVPGCPYCD